MRLFAVIPLLLILNGAGLSYVGMLPGLIGWGLCAVGVLIGLVAAIIIFFARIRKGQSHFWLYAIIAVAPFVFAVPLVVNSLNYPPINDVATDLEDPLAFEAALNAGPNKGRDMSFPETFGPIVRKAYPNIQPLVLDRTPEQAFQRVEKLVKTQAGWVITRRDADKRILEGEATSSVFRFVDDFVIRVSDQEGKARVDMRSKSRDGVSDVGANAKRIEAFFAQLVK